MTNIHFDSLTNIHFVPLTNIHFVSLHQQPLCLPALTSTVSLTNIHFVSLTNIHSVSLHYHSFHPSVCSTCLQDAPSLRDDEDGKLVAAALLTVHHPQRVPGAGSQLAVQADLKLVLLHLSEQRRTCEISCICLNNMQNVRDFLTDRQEGKQRE